MYGIMIINLDVSANLTNGVTAMVNTAPGGELHGISVTWRIKSEHLDCRFTTLRVELYISGQVVKVGKDISVSDRTVDFSSDHLDCNEKYTPRVRAIHVSSTSTTTVTDNGVQVIYRGNLRLFIHTLPFCVQQLTLLDDNYMIENLYVFR